MQRLIDVNLVLRVYEKICRLGKKQQEHYLYEGLSASSDWDGYTIVVANSQLELSVFFHNKYQFSSHDDKAIEGFIKQLKFIDEQ